MRGRPRKSTQEKALAGTNYKKRNKGRELNWKELKELPDPLPYWPDDYVELYYSQGNKLIAQGVLNSGNIELFQAYISQLGFYFRTQKEMITCTDIKKQAYFARVANEALKMVRQWAAEFGLTPLAAMRIKLPEPKKEDDFTQFLKSDES